jgi:hypothetical protein
MVQMFTLDLQFVALALTTTSGLRHKRGPAHLHWFKLCLDGRDEALESVSPLVEREGKPCPR